MILRVLPSLLFAGTCSVRRSAGLVRGKLFFFVDYQGQRFDFPASTGTRDAFHRRGTPRRLLATVDQAGNPALQPVPNRCEGKTDTFRKQPDPFEHDRSGSAESLLLDVYPLPMTGDLANNYVNTTSSHNNVDQGDARVDYRMAQRDQIYGRISEGFQDSPTINSFRLFNNAFNQSRIENGVVSWTHNFSPNVLNELGGGANYVRVETGGSRQWVRKFG